MPTKFDDIENAFLFVSSGPYGENTALLNPETGELSYRSEMDVDDEEPDWDNSIKIPHKNDLDLGKALVFRFVSDHLPDDYDRVRDMFRGPGAYARFKDFLHSKDLLERWYQFEDEETKTALREWCEEHDIALID